MVYNTRLLHKTQRFENCICARRQVKGIRHILCWVPRVGLAFFFSRDTTGYVSFPTHLRTETCPVPETLCLIVSIIPEDGQIPETQ
jgi:hypothetical protein